MKSNGISSAETTIRFDDGETNDSEKNEAATEIEGRGQLDVEVQEKAGDDGKGADMPIHTFEKAETLEEYTGLSRKSDDEDELEDHEEALQDTNMNRVLRSRDRPSSIYRAAVLLESPLFEAKDDLPKRGIPYPKWEFKRRTYRENWCYIQEEDPGSPDTDWAATVESDHHALILDLKKKFAHLATEWLRSKRQPAGGEFDIESLVDNQIQWRSGTSPDENIYLHRNRELHDVAALRHAQESLTKRKACRRVVILVTDGRPCDYDRYEGTYGIKDIKMALETGRRHGIHAHAFAIEKRAKEYYPAMFTADHFSIVPTPKALTKSLCDLFAKLRAH